MRLLFGSMGGREIEEGIVTYWRIQRDTLGFSDLLKLRRYCLE